MPSYGSVHLDIAIAGDDLADQIVDTCNKDRAIQGVRLSRRIAGLSY